MTTFHRVTAGVVVALTLSSCGPTAVTASSPTTTSTTFATPRATVTPLVTARPLRSSQPLPSPTLPTFVLSYERFSDIQTIHGPELLVTSDGEALAAPNWGKALTLRRLTPAGVDVLRKAVLDTGLFTQSRSIGRELRPGGTAAPGGRGYESISVAIRSGDHDVRVSTFARDPDDSMYVWESGRDELLAVAARLADLSWLPVSVWSDATPQPYVANFHRLYVETLRGASQPALPGPVESVWPFTIPPETFGGPVPPDPASPPNLSARCAILTAIDALDLGVTLAGGTAYRPELRVTSGAYIWRAGNGEVYLQLEPLLPHVTPTCDGVRRLY